MSNRRRVRLRGIAAEPARLKSKTPPDDVQRGGYVSHNALCCQRARVYFNWVLIEPKLVLSFVPRPFTTAMIASAIPDAIRPYSIAVAPDSFFRNSEIN